MRIFYFLDESHRFPFSVFKKTVLHFCHLVVPHTTQLRTKIYFSHSFLFPSTKAYRIGDGKGVCGEGGAVLSRHPTNIQRRCHTFVSISEDIETHMGQDGPHLDMLLLPVFFLFGGTSFTEGTSTYIPKSDGKWAAQTYPSRR